jgi:hypothetical protein
MHFNHAGLHLASQGGTIEQLAQVHMHAAHCCQPTVHHLIFTPALKSKLTLQFVHTPRVIDWGSESCENNDSTKLWL